MPGGCGEARKPESLERAHPVDLKRLHEVSGNDPDFVKTLIHIFLENTEQCLTTLERALERSDLEQIRLQAHTIRGACSNAGARDLSVLAETIENLTKDPCANFDSSLVTGLKEEFQKVRGFLLELARS
jgi:HPt (histidine-containing phosphotransfer) domain-containing protein